MKYYVEVTRIAYARQTLAVEAESAAQAEDLALKHAPDEDFSTYESEYEVSAVEPASQETRRALGAWSGRSFG